MPHMTGKVRRGLGLLAVAALAALIGFAVLQGSGGVDGPAGWALAIVGITAAVAFWGSLIAGLVMIAWGLLRPVD